MAWNRNEANAVRNLHWTEPQTSQRCDSQVFSSFAALSLYFSEIIDPKMAENNAEISSKPQTKKKSSLGK